MKIPIHKLSIIIPAYNEAATIGPLVEKILEVSFPIDYEIIIVDDHSSDETRDISKDLESSAPRSGRIRVLHNKINRGKGFSIRRGMRLALGEVVVIQDADFEYEPADLPGLLKPILEGLTPVVYGSRFLGKFWPHGMALPNMIANRFLTLMTNILFGCRLSDMETCYKLIRRDTLKGIHLSTERFDFEPEITCKLVKKGIPILERPIRYRGRTAGEGKKIKARDFFIALRVLFQNRFWTRKPKTRVRS